MSFEPTGRGCWALHRGMRDRHAFWIPRRNSYVITIQPTTVAAGGLDACFAPQPPDLLNFGLEAEIVRVFAVFLLEQP